MFLKEFPNRNLTKDVYDRCTSLMPDYFDSKFGKFPELYVWAFLKRIEFLQLWKLLNLLAYYKLEVDLTNPKNKKHYEDGIKQLNGVTPITWKFYVDKGK